MKLILENNLFESSNKIKLKHILYSALQNNAYLEFDIEAINQTDWISSHDLVDWKLAYDISINDIANFRIENCVTVSLIPKSNWEHEPPSITLDDACNLINMPVEIWLENQRNDGDFIKLFLSENSLSLFQNLIDRNRIKLEGKGGINEMKAVLESTQHSVEKHNKRFIICDSDAPKPNHPQKEAINIENICKNKKIKHHILRRRSIENYFPVQYLLEKIHPNVRKNSNDAKKYQAFISLKSNQKHHFHMKNGFFDNSCYYSEIYNDELALNTILENNLHEGFGSKFSQKFISNLRNTIESEKIRDLMHEEDESDELSDLENKLINYIRVPS